MNKWHGPMRAALGVMWLSVAATPAIASDVPGDFMARVSRGTGNTPIHTTELGIPGLWHGGNRTFFVHS